ncbi:hypothetical protein RSAG8_12251, partial [Rhizoctonia solani AG-8 WAC10335]
MTFSRTKSGRYRWARPGKIRINGNSRFCATASENAHGNTALSLHTTAQSHHPSVHPSNFTSLFWAHSLRIIKRFRLHVGGIICDGLWIPGQRRGSAHSVQTGLLNGWCSACVHGPRATKHVLLLLVVGR